MQPAEWWSFTAASAVLWWMYGMKAEWSAGFEVRKTGTEWRWNGMYWPKAHWYNKYLCFVSGTTDGWWGNSVVYSYGVNSSQGEKIYHWKAKEKSSGNTHGMEHVEWKECSFCCGVQRRMHELKVKWSGGSKWGTNEITERKCNLKRNASTASTLINQTLMFLWPATTVGWWGKSVVWIGSTPENSPIGVDTFCSAFRRLTFSGVNSSQKKKKDHWKALEKVRGGTERKAPKWVDIAWVNCFYVAAGK